MKPLLGFVAQPETMALATGDLATNFAFGDPRLAPSAQIDTGQAF